MNIVFLGEEPSRSTSPVKTTDEDCQTNVESTACSDGTGNVRSRIRRRRSERPTYVRRNTSHCISSTTSQQETTSNPSADEASNITEVRSTFRVRRCRRQRTVTVLESDVVDSPLKSNSDILRIDESEDDDLSQLVSNLDKLTENFEKPTAGMGQDRALDISRRRRRRDPLLRRLQNVESFSKKDIVTKSVGTCFTTCETGAIAKPRERRRRSLRRSSDDTNGNRTTAEQPAGDSKHGNSSPIPVTQIDEVIVTGMSYIMRNFYN